MANRRRDEAYALALCDEIIGTPSIREARFDWLLGDPGKNGTRRRLPVDAYWPHLGLVIEFWEYQHHSPTPFFDKPERLTISGVPPLGPTRPLRPATTPTHPRARAATAGDPQG